MFVTVSMGKPTGPASPVVRACTAFQTIMRRKRLHRAEEGYIDGPSSRRSCSYAQGPYLPCEGLSLVLSLSDVLWPFDIDLPLRGTCLT